MPIIQARSKIIRASKKAVAPTNMSDLFGSNLIVWYRADNVVFAPDPIAPSNLLVSQWTDLSGKGNHATQSDDQRKPIYLNSGFNSKPTLDFYNTAWMGMPNCLSNAWGQATLFVLYDLLDTTQNWMATHFGAANNDAYWGTNSAFGFTGYFGEFRNTRLDSQPPNMTVAGKALVEVSAGAMSYSVTKNTTSIYSAVDMLYFGVTATPYIGRDNALTRLMNGKISEIILVNRVATGTETTAVRNYLKTFWNLTMY